MKILLAGIAALTMISTSSLSASTTVPATDPSVRIMGRVVEKDGSVTMAFPGVETLVRFTGSKSVAIRGKVPGDSGAAGYFNVHVDGEALPTIRIPAGDFDLTLANALDPAKEHTLRLVRRNEAWVGLVRLDAIALDDGAKFLPPPPFPTRKILAIGDSITCGYNNEFLPPAEPGPQHENAELAYGWLLAKDFGAQVNLVSYGGKGLVRDWR
ncbi:MAG TPA: hypothetical protein PKI32_09400, partial [Opitutales bacterium]|nr:hypothetical protein [Opitutales bacterium]